MICDSCGKSNAKGVLNCAYCGSEMPKTTETSGFSDILTFKASEPVETVSPYGTEVGVNDVAERGAEFDMKRITENPEDFIKKNMFSLIAIGVSILVLICSICMNISTGNKIDNLNDLYQTQLNEPKETPSENKPKETPSENKPTELDEDGNPESRDDKEVKLLESEKIGSLNKVAKDLKRILNI